MSDHDVITERDIVDPITVWVDCELGERGCTGGDYAAEMVHDGEGWICPSCHYAQNHQHEENERYLNRLYYGG